MRWSSGILCLAGIPCAAGFIATPGGTGAPAHASAIGVRSAFAPAVCGVTSAPLWSQIGSPKGEAGEAGVVGSSSAGLSMSAEKGDRRALLGRVVLPAIHFLLAEAILPRGAEAAAGAPKKPEALITGPVGEGVIAPTEEQTEVIRRAFKAFDDKRLEEADRLFTEGINTWITLKRPRDEMGELYKTRGNVRVDLKRFPEAKEDYDRVISLMSSDGERPDGTAAYMEYPDAFVQRGLANEGLGDWESAVNDYSRAIGLWGGGRGEGINPYTLTFRANALGRLGRYSESVSDYEAAEALFLKERDLKRAVDSRANRALSLYETGAVKEAVKAYREIIRRSPGYADMRIALAAHLWANGEQGEAESQWEFACNNISVGCKKYKDEYWVSSVRRWPPTMAANLRSFLGKTGKQGAPTAAPP